MKSPDSFLSFVWIFLATSLPALAHDSHDGFLKCLFLQSQNSISQVFYTPKNSSYFTLLQSSAENRRFQSASVPKPSFLLTPSNESHIQDAIYCSKEHGMQIRVRSGGHDYEGSSYVSEVPFVVIDLRNFRSISIDNGSRIAWVEAGATLGELYFRIAKTSRNLAFVAGVWPAVGVGGHFSGGGYGMMSRKFGLASDNIIDAKIIDVKGRILDRQSMGEDLFWAIRGGGGASFGIIIAWKVKLLHVPPKVTVFNVSRTSDQNATKLVHQWQFIADKVDENLLIRPFVKSVKSSSAGKRTIVAFFTSLFLGGVDELLPLMQKSFPELGLVKEDCDEMSWIESALCFACFPKGKSEDILLNRTPLTRAFFKGKSDFVQQPISENDLEGIWQWLHEEDENIAELQFSPFGGRLAEIPESETAFPHRSGNIYMVHQLVRWEEKDSKDAERHIKWIRELYDYMAPYVSESPRAAFYNYRDHDLGINNDRGRTSYRKASIWGIKYFKSNFDRLVSIKTAVDPDNFFSSEQSIPSLVSYNTEFKGEL